MVHTGTLSWGRGGGGGGGVYSEGTLYAESDIDIDILL